MLYIVYSILYMYIGREQGRVENGFRPQALAPFAHTYRYIMTYLIYYYTII